MLQFYQVHDLKETTESTKVATWSLSKTMAARLAQEYHFWLNLLHMRDTDKVCFLNPPISQTGLFADTVRDNPIVHGSVRTVK